MSSDLGFEDLDEAHSYGCGLMLEEILVIDDVLRMYKTQLNLFLAYGRRDNPQAFELAKRIVYYATAVDGFVGRNMALIHDEDQSTVVSVATR